MRAELRKHVDPVSLEPAADDREGGEGKLARILTPLVRGGRR